MKGEPFVRWACREKSAAWRAPTTFARYESSKGRVERYRGRAVDDVGDAGEEARPLGGRQAQPRPLDVSRHEAELARDAAAEPELAEEDEASLLRAERRASGPCCRCRFRSGRQTHDDLGHVRVAGGLRQHLAAEEAGGAGQEDAEPGVRSAPRPGRRPPHVEVARSARFASRSGMGARSRKRKPTSRPSRPRSRRVTPREGGIVEGGAQRRGRALARLARQLVVPAAPTDSPPVRRTMRLARTWLARETGCESRWAATRSSSGRIGPGTSRPVVRSMRAT